MSLVIDEAWIRTRVKLKHDNLDDVRSLSLPGTYQEKITSIGTSMRNFSRLQTLDLSRNCITSLEGMGHLSLLETLNVYYNNIETLKALDCLKKNSNLKTLDIRLNPVSANDADYRLFLIHILPNLDKLDDRLATDGERKASLMHFGPLNEDSASFDCAPASSSANSAAPTSTSSTDKLQQRSQREQEAIDVQNSRLNHVNSLAKAPHILNTQDAPISALVFCGNNEPPTTSSACHRSQDTPTSRSDGLIDSQLVDTPPIFTGSKAVHPSVIDYSFDAICQLESISNSESHYSDQNLLNSDHKSSEMFKKNIDQNSTMERNYPNLANCHKEIGVQMPKKSNKSANPHDIEDNIYTSYKSYPVFTSAPKIASKHTRKDFACEDEPPSTSKCSLYSDGAPTHHDQPHHHHDQPHHQNHHQHHQDREHLSPSVPHDSFSSSAAVYSLSKEDNNLVANGHHCPLEVEPSSSHNRADSCARNAYSSRVHNGSTPVSRDPSPQDYPRSRRLRNPPESRTPHGNAPSTGHAPNGVPAPSAQEAVDSISSLVDKYWNGANSLKKNEQFKAYIQNMLQPSMKPNNNNNSNNIRNNNHASIEETILLRKQIDKLEKEVIRLRNLSTMDPVEIVRLTEENKLLQTSVENLTQSLKTSRQLQDMVEIVQESHRSLSQANEHLLSQLASEKLRSDSEIRNLHWSYEQLKKNSGFLAANDASAMKVVPPSAMM